MCAYRWSNYCLPILVPIGTYYVSQDTHSFWQSNGFSRVHWRVHSNRFASFSLRISFSKFSVTTRLTLSVPKADGHLITEERKLEVPPRETLRMSDTLGYIYIYIYDIASVYIPKRRGARVSYGTGGFCDFDFCHRTSISMHCCVEIYKDEYTCEKFLRETARFTDRRCVFSTWAPCCKVPSFNP